MRHPLYSLSRSLSNDHRIARVCVAMSEVSSAQHPDPSSEIHLSGVRVSRGFSTNIFRMVTEQDIHNIHAYQKFLCNLLDEKVLWVQLTECVRVSGEEARGFLAAPRSCLEEEDRRTDAMVKSWREKSFARV